MAKKFEGYPDHFLNLTIEIEIGEGEEKTKHKTDVTGKDYYQILGVEKDSSESEINKAYKRKSLETHPDKGGNAEKFKQLGEAFSILKNPNTRNQYDKFYEVITGEKPDQKFRGMVIARLLRLSRRTEDNLGIHQNSGLADGGLVEGEDISDYLHLFPSEESIRSSVNGGKTKFGISRYANWVIHFYTLLRTLEDEVNGSDRATINTTRRAIEPSKMGLWSNFRKDILAKKTYDEVVNYDNHVKRKIREIICGKTSQNLYAWQDAQEENLLMLRGMRGWDSFSGPENLQGSEKFHFATGFSFGEKGIINLRFDKPNHWAYNKVIRQAEVFRDIKEKIAQKVVEFRDLRDREGGGVNQVLFAELSGKLERLGKLEQVESMAGTQGKDYAFTTTKTKFSTADSQLLQRGIDQVFNEFRTEINRVGAKPLGTADNSGGGFGGEPWRVAIQEIENALRETELESQAENILKSKTWRNKFEYEFRNNSAKINEWRTGWLGLIYRVKARRKITDELNINSVSLSKILGSSKTLKDHFKNFKDKASINAERNRLLTIIRDYGQGRGGKIQDAIAAVKKFLQDNQLENDPAKIESILGKDWENHFHGLSNETSIDEIRDKFIRKIKDLMARDKSGAMAAIQEIKRLLAANNLSESIFEPNWKDCFQGKNETEIIGELERLKKIIIASGGKVPEMIADSQTSSINRIKNKLKEGHKKLVVQEEELPPQILAPYKTVEEKINSLNKLEDISAFENKLREVITQKKQEKLTAIANGAIAEIKREIGQDQIELGKNKDYENKLKNTNDPDIIELIKEDILNLIREQKGSKENEEFFGSPDSDEPSFFNLKNLGIVALIIIPVTLIGFVILRFRQKKLKQRGY